MALSFRKFISEVFVNGKFPKISRYTVIWFGESKTICQIRRTFPLYGNPSEVKMTKVGKTTKLVKIT